MLSSIRGITILETLVGLALGVFVVGGTIAMLYGVMRSNTETLRITRMEHEMRSALSLMATDIRRAGYWASATTDINSNASTNPFMDAATTIQVNADNDCILFAYDSDGDGVLPALSTAPSDNRFGYRLSGNIIQSRPSSFSTLNCTGAANQWDDITNDSVVTITNLTFTLNTQAVDVDGAGSGTSTASVRSVDISMTGALASDPTVTRTLSESIRVRNDLFTP